MFSESATVLQTVRLLQIWSATRGCGNS